MTQQHVHKKLIDKLLTYDMSIESAHRVVEDNYVGLYKSIGDFAQDLIDERLDIPEWVQKHIDFEGLAKNLISSGDFCSIETGDEKYHILSKRKV